jgi:hypothetical protein
MMTTICYFILLNEDIPPRSLIMNKLKLLIVYKYLLIINVLFDLRYKEAVLGASSLK